MIVIQQTRTPFHVLLNCVSCVSGTPFFVWRVGAMPTAWGDRAERSTGGRHEGQSQPLGTSGRYSVHVRETLSSSCTAVRCSGSDPSVRCLHLPLSFPSILLLLSITHPLFLPPFPPPRLLPFLPLLASLSLPPLCSISSGLNMDLHSQIESLEEDLSEVEHQAASGAANPLSLSLHFHANYWSTLDLPG